MLSEASMQFKIRTRETFIVINELILLEEELKFGFSSRPGLARAIQIGRATAFIIFYNALEYGMTEAVGSLRNRIAAVGIEFNELRDWWRRDIVRFMIEGTIRTGCSNDTLYERVEELLSGHVTLIHEAKRNEKLPFPGNMNKSRVHKWCKDVSLSVRFPKICQGGQFLDAIWRHRNDLAHGKQSFEDIGNLYTRHELRKEFLRVRLFMKCLLNGIEDYSTAGGFRN